MFIAWEQRRMFHDTLEAMAWQRAPQDCSRIIAMWEHQFASQLDPVRGALPEKE